MPTRPRAHGLSIASQADTALARSSASGGDESMWRPSVVDAALRLAALEEGLLGDDGRELRVQPVPVPQGAAAELTKPTALRRPELLGLVSPHRLQAALLVDHGADHGHRPLVGGRCRDGAAVGAHGAVVGSGRRARSRSAVVADGHLHRASRAARAAGPFDFRSGMGR
eukprot:scaffold2570_cov72-Phaeocystis_antarctica.AAC.3